MQVTSAQTVGAAKKTQGCHSVGMPKNYVCVTIEGKGKYIKKAHAIRGKLTAGRICKSRGTFTVFDRRGKVIYQRSSYRNGCVVGRGWFTWKVNKTFKNGTKACASWREKGKHVGTACLKLK